MPPEELLRQKAAELLEPVLVIAKAIARSYLSGSPPLLDWRRFLSQFRCSLVG